MLVMETSHGDTTITYTLSDTAIRVHATATASFYDWTIGFSNITEEYGDTLRQIAKMKAKSYDCREQHALLVDRITFTNDSGTVEIDPNVNHPKEIDAAVRIFNRYAPDEYFLWFIDMQPAIEPNGKMQI